MKKIGARPKKPIVVPWNKRRGSAKPNGSLWRESTVNENASRRSARLQTRTSSPGFVPSFLTLWEGVVRTCLIFALSKSTQARTPSSGLCPPGPRSWMVRPGTSHLGASHTRPGFMVPRVGDGRSSPCRCTVSGRGRPAGKRSRSRRIFSYFLLVISVWRGEKRLRRGEEKECT